LEHENKKAIPECFEESPCVLDIIRGLEERQRAVLVDDTVEADPGDGSVLASGLSFISKR